MVGSIAVEAASADGNDNVAQEEEERQQRHGDESKQGKLFHWLVISGIALLACVLGAGGVLFRVMVEVRVFIFKYGGWVAAFSMAFFYLMEMEKSQGKESFNNPR